MQFLRASTSITIRIGPFVDSGDGFTPEPGLTINQSDIRLSKNGADFAQSNNTSGATHDENGWYYLTLDTTDTETRGRLTVAIYVSGALPVWQEYTILPASVYDSLVAGTDFLQADAVQIEGTDATNQIRDAVVDDATRIDASALNTLSGLAPASTLATGAAVQTVDDNVDAILLDTGTDGVVLANNAITDAKIADGAITAAKIAAAAANKIADHLLKRSMASARASSDGDGTGRFPLQALAFLRNRRAPSGSNLNIYQEDDNTLDWAAAVTTSASAEPITEIDPS